MQPLKLNQIGASVMLPISNAREVEKNFGGKILPSVQKWEFDEIRRNTTSAPKTSALWQSGIRISTQWSKSRIKDKEKIAEFLRRGYQSPYTMKLSIGIAQFSSWGFTRMDKIGFGIDPESKDSEGFATRLLFVSERTSKELLGQASTSFYQLEVLHATGIPGHVSLNKFNERKLAETVICNVGYEFSNICRRYNDGCKILVRKYPSPVILPDSNYWRGPVPASIIVDLPTVK